MPRMITEDLVGYKLDLMQGERQVHDDGMPVFNGSGEPKMETTWLLVFTGMGPDGSMHRVMAPMLNAEAKDKLVQALTGGVVVPTIQLPDGITL